MNCPQCEATYTLVTSVDPTGGDMVTRRRKCVECNHAFTTVEVYANVYERMKARAANFQTMVSQEARAKAAAMVERHNG